MNMKLAIAVVTAGVISSAAIAAKGERREDNRHRGCTQATLHGAYGFQFQGTRPVRPPFAVGVESFAAIAIRTYDGAGSFTQVTTTRGTVVGVDQDFATSGTYDVNEDCSGSAAAQTPAGVSVDRFVIVDNASIVRNVVISPANVMVTGIAEKIHTR